ncbi:MAG: polysaccharide lyase 6 family protein [bacterium]
MKIKKIFCAALATSAVVSLAACSTEEVLVVDSYTNFETVQQFIDEFEVPNKDSIVKNVYLPKNIGEDGNIIWESNKSDVLGSTGVVGRTFVDEEVSLTAVVTLGGTKQRFYYDVTVKAMPTTQKERLDEAIENFYLTEEIDGKLVIDRDIMTLPRVTDLHTVYVDWATSDDSIIDLEGNVYRTSKEQKVTLTGTFTYYPYDTEIVSSNLETVTKTYEVNVGSTSDDSPEVVDSSLKNIRTKVEVTDTTELIAALIDPQPGTAIILKDGIYRNFQYTMTNSGTADNPIYIFAENPGEVFFNGDTQFNIEADHVVIANLTFTNGKPADDKGVIVIEGHYNRITNCVIDAFEQVGLGYKWISLSGSHHEVDRNHLMNKGTSGSLMVVWREDLETQYHTIHLNHFENFYDTGGNNGYETIRIGTSDYSQSDSNVLVENNIFEACAGEIEIISVKSGRTIVRNNTFDECLGLITFRHGKNNLAEGNIFYGAGESDAGGVRMYDGGHIVRNNYMYDLGGNNSTRAAIVVHTGINSPNSKAVLNLQWTAYNILIENNTLVDCDYSIMFCAGYTYKTTDITIRDNVITGNSNAAIYIGTDVFRPTVTGNYLYAGTHATSGTTVATALADDTTGNNTDTYGNRTNLFATVPTGTGFNETLVSVGATGLVELSPSNVGVNWTYTSQS